MSSESETGLLQRWGRLGLWTGLAFAGLVVYGFTVIPTILAAIEAARNTCCNNTISTSVPTHSPESAAEPDPDLKSDIVIAAAVMLVVRRQGTLPESVNVSRSAGPGIRNKNAVSRIYRA